MEAAVTQFCTGTSYLFGFLSCIASQSECVSCKWYGFAVDGSTPPTSLSARSIVQLRFTIEASDSFLRLICYQQLNSWPNLKSLSTRQHGMLSAHLESHLCLNLLTASASGICRCPLCHFTSGQVSASVGRRAFRQVLLPLDTSPSLSPSRPYVYSTGHYAHDVQNSLQRVIRSVM